MFASLVTDTVTLHIMSHSVDSLGPILATAHTPSYIHHHDLQNSGPREVFSSWQRNISVQNDHEQNANIHRVKGHDELRACVAGGRWATESKRNRSERGMQFRT